MNKEDKQNLIYEKQIRVQHLTKLISGLSDKRERLAFVKLITELHKQIKDLRKEIEDEE